MAKPVTFQLLDYPGSQKSALWGLKDVLDFAGSHELSQDVPRFRTGISEAPNGAPDVVVLPPALSFDPPELPPGWRAALIAQHKAGTAMASVCSGAFLLAQAGLLEWRRVTTHWRHASGFRQKYPKAVIDTDRLLVDLGDIITAGGVMAWTDLVLHMIQRFDSRRLMMDVARMFVLDPPEREQSYYASFIPDVSHPDRQIAGVTAMDSPERLADVSPAPIWLSKRTVAAFERACLKSRPYRRPGIGPGPQPLHWLSAQ